MYRHRGGKKGLASKISLKAQYRILAVIGCASTHTLGEEGERQTERRARATDRERREEREEGKRERESNICFSFTKDSYCAFLDQCSVSVMAQQTLLYGVCFLYLPLFSPLTYHFSLLVSLRLFYGSVMI